MTTKPEGMPAIRAFWQQVRGGKNKSIRAYLNTQAGKRPPSPKAKLPSSIEEHRAAMLHDRLAKAPDYRRLLAEACVEYDAAIARGKARGRPKKSHGPGITVPRSKRKAA